MAIRRGPIPADSFTIVSNAWLRDPRLSWKAKGLLAYIASHAAGYVLTAEQIESASRDGRDAVRAGLLELEEIGYLRRIKRRAEDGKVTGTDYELTDAPAPEDGKAGAGKPVAGADQQERSDPAAQTSDGFSGAGQPAGKKTTSQKTKKTPSATPRGSRLPEDWRPSPEDFQWLREQYAPGGWTDELKRFFADQHESFKDYFAAAPGQKGVKVRWNATWRNWMRTAWRRDWRGARPQGPPAAKPYVQLADEYKATKAQIEKACTDLAQQLIDAGMSGTEAVNLARKRVHERLAAGEALETSTSSTYIEGTILVEDQKEVTGS